MPLTQELRRKHHDLWHKVVDHPFVVEMGDGTLPTEKFKSYFLQDYIFVKDLVSMTALAVSKAPDFQAAGRLNQFLTGILDPENDLFVRAFKELGASEEEVRSVTAAPSCQAFGDFMMRVGLEGDFEEIIAALYVTEGTYLDWGSRLLEAGKRPNNPVYREWIDVHGPQVLAELVTWMGQGLDEADLGHRLPRIERNFHTALRYEYLFFEGAYIGESWPDW